MYEARHLKTAGINMSGAIIGKSILFICVSLLISGSLSAAEFQSKEHSYWPTNENGMLLKK
jgi:hypothetical protein